MPHFQKRQRVFLLSHHGVIGPCRVTRVNDDNTFNLSYYRRDGKRVVNYAIEAPKIFANVIDALAMTPVGSVSEFADLKVRKTPEYLYEIKVDGKPTLMVLCSYAADLIDRAIAEAEQARRAKGRRESTNKRPSYPFSVKWIAYNDDAVNMDQDNIEGYISTALVADQFNVCREKVAADILKLRVEWERTENAQNLRDLADNPVEA